MKVLSKKTKGGEGTRRLSRKLALTLLYQRDSSMTDPVETMRLFEENFSPDEDEEGSLEISPAAFRAAWPLAVELFMGVSSNQADLDRDIEKVLLNWRLDRVSKVDRALIRLAYYEMLHRPDIPFRISLNEAVEIAKAFGETESRTFVNGVLDQLKNLIPEKDLV
jgi:N utilization substance protein B